MDISDGDNIKKLPVRFKPKVEEKQLVQPYEVRKQTCFHQQFVVDETLAEVECAKCGQKLNPMWVLRQLCNKEAMWVNSQKRYQDEMKRLEERSRTKCEHCDKMTRISRK